MAMARWNTLLHMPSKEPLPFPETLREMKRGLSLAELGTHLKPEHRKIDSFPCTALGQVVSAPVQTSLLPGVPHGPQVKHSETNEPVHRAEDAKAHSLLADLKDRHEAPQGQHKTADAGV